MKSLSNLILLLVLVIAVSACSNNGVSVTAKFDNTQDIGEGTSVYLGDKLIGSVSDISKTEHGSVVQMSLDSKLSKKVNSKAAVVVNRLRQGAPLEFHNPPGKIVSALENGQTVQGLDSMLQLVGWGVGSGFDAGLEGISAFKDYLKSDEFERDKANAGIALDEGMKAAKDGLQEAGKTLEATINGVNLSEQELAAVVEELGDELAPVVKEFAQSGTELMLELERFAQNLEDTSAENQDSGEQFLESLTEALNTLNQSFEEGIEDGLNHSDESTEIDN